MFNAEVGDRFEDLDPRAGDRVIRVVEKRETRGAPKYRYVVEVSSLNPKTVGRRRRISHHTLATRFRKVSH